MVHRGLAIGIDLLSCGATAPYMWVGGPAPGPPPMPKSWESPPRVRAWASTAALLLAPDPEGEWAVGSGWELELPLSKPADANKNKTEKENHGQRRAKQRRHANVSTKQTAVGWLCVRVQWPNGESLSPAVDRRGCAGWSHTCWDGLRLW